eukprot:3369362-Rhodomonas_salina.1
MREATRTALQTRRALPRSASENCEEDTTRELARSNDCVERGREKGRGREGGRERGRGREGKREGEREGERGGRGRCVSAVGRWTRGGVRWGRKQKPR